MHEKGGVAEWQRSTPIGQNRLIIMGCFLVISMVFFRDNVVPTDQDPYRNFSVLGGTVQISRKKKKKEGIDGRISGGPRYDLTHRKPLFER